MTIDAKLAALMGAWLGPLGLGLAVSLSVLGGALIGGLALVTAGILVGVRAARVSALAVPR